LLVAAVALTALTRDPWPTNDGLGLALLAAFAAVGLVIARRQPRNAVGWILVGVALVALLDDVAQLYLVLDYRMHHGDLPFGSPVVFWVGGYSLLPILFGLPAILLFPDGRAPSKRWRRLLQGYLALAVLFSIAQFVGQASVSVGPQLHVTIRGNLPSNKQPVGAVANAAWVVAPLFVLAWASFIGYQLACWRRSTGERRAQVQWLMSGGAICVISCIAIVILGDGSSGTARCGRPGLGRNRGASDQHRRRHPPLPAV
jgi:hypothetical protein